MANKDFRRAARGKGRSDALSARAFSRSYDRFVSTIWFRSEAESIQPENVEITKKAFVTFCQDMDWDLPIWCFEDLLAEKSGEHSFRADGRTPNWYHEFRECMCFLAFVRAGHLKERDLVSFGGVEVGLGSLWRHDSWEDFGKNKCMIFAPLEARVHKAAEAGFISDDESVLLRKKAAAIADKVDLLTRKIPTLDEHGHFLRKPNGKPLKKDRFDGQDNLYYNRILSDPLTTIGKYFDGIEGMSTRIGVLNYSREDDIKYTYERRKLYGRRALDIEAQIKFPFLKPALRAADSMLGILLVSMETVNDFAKDSGQHPKYATPIRIGEYLPAATRGFKFLPPAFHPMHIFLERMESKVIREIDTPEEGRTRLLIDNAIKPSLGNYFDDLRRPDLSRRPLSGPNEQYEPDSP